MKKKCIALITTVAMLLLTAIPSFATSSDTSIYEFMSVEALAYCDLDEAPLEYQDDILVARDIIIHNTNWTVDGQVAIVHEDGTLQTLPEFSDLFPDWDIPSAEPLTNTAVPYTASFAGNVYLIHPSETEQAPAFYYFYPDGNVIMGTTYIPGTSWNGAYTNYTTLHEVGNVLRLSEGEAMTLTTPNPNHLYGARASTFSTEGYAIMYVMEVSDL